MSTVLVSALVVSFLALLVSGKNIRCPDAKYEENCVLRLENPKIRRHPPQHESYQPIYPSYGLNYSNYGLTELILAERSTEGNVIQNTFNNKTNSSDPRSIEDDDVMPFIDLHATAMLILSNNSVTIDELMTILHDERYGDPRDTNILTYLDVSYLNISWLPENIFEFFTSMEVLRLNNNPIRNMDRIIGALKPLTYLEELDISGCDLQYLPYDSFKGLRLRSLNLNNNLFTSVPNLNYLSYTLFKLSIDNNPIRFLDDTSFRTLHFIEEISSENCRIQGITGGTFSTNDNLRKLNLKNNSLQYVLPSDIPWRSTWINLENNPWDCSCRNFWLMRETHHVNTNLIHPHDIRCRTPAVYKHWPLYDVFKVLEENNECKEFLDEFVKLFSGMETQSPSLSSYPELRGLWLCEKTVTNLFIITMLLTVFAVLLRRKCVRSSRPYVIYNIVQHKEKLNLDDKNNIQHM